MKSCHDLTFGCRVRVGLVGLIVSCLGACSNPAADWTRPGITDARRDADYAACRDQARADSGERIDQDVLSSRAAQGHGPAPADDAPASTSAGDSRIASEGVIACMTDLGYHGQ